jgi:nucleotide-binding universal stress UspA family protein
MPSPDPSVLETVMVGVDGSERSLEAARQAIRLSALASRSVLAAYVIDTGRPHDEDLELEAGRALDAVREIARREDVAVEGRILEGDPAAALADEADEHGATLLCVGMDAGLLGGAIRVGHTAAELLRHARCSILVARPAGDAFPVRIICAVDGSDASADTASVAAAVAVPAGAELRLIHVVPVFRGANSEWTLGPDDETPAELEPSVLAAASRGAIAVREMAMGRPERAIVAATERDGADLAVVGHRGLTGVRRVLLGSVSEHVAHHAACSVLVVRATAREMAS